MSPDSPFFQILTSKPFLAPKAARKSVELLETELDIHKLLIFGLLYCKGDHKEKASAFYDILQDAFQEQISASDKELVWAFILLIKLPTAWVHYWSQKHYQSGDTAS